MNILSLILEGGLIGVFISLFAFLSSLLGFLAFIIPGF
jgi:hypothetical protein